MKKLDWQNLRTLNCPACFGDLVKNPFGTFHCENVDCNFSIYEQKLRDIVKPMFHNPEDPFGEAEFEEMMKNP